MRDSDGSHLQVTLWGRFYANNQCSKTLNELFSSIRNFHLDIQQRFIPFKK